MTSNLTFRTFTATATIAGRQLSVSYTPSDGVHGDLVLGGVTVDEALAFVNSLVVGGSAPAPAPAQAAPEAAPKAERPKADPAKSRAKQPAQASADDKSVAGIAAEAVAAYEDSAARVAAQASQEDPALPKAALEAPTKAAKKPTSAAKGDAGYRLPELPQAVRNTTAMRDLLVWMVDEAKVPDVDTLVRVCSEAKDSIPVLAKVPDVDTRVRRAVEVIDLFNSDAVTA